MRKLELQLFGNEAVQGKKLVYLYRILSEAAKENGGTDNIGVVLIEPFADEVSVL